jgi:alanyl aminopeptidase
VGFCDDAHRKEMVDFFTPRLPHLPGGPRLLSQAEERMALCSAYNAAQHPSVATFLKRW